MTAVAAAPIVVKVGGSCVDDLSHEWWNDLACLATETGSTRLVLVHGWSTPLAAYAASTGRSTTVLRDRFGNQSRLTTDQTIEDIHTVSAALASRIAGLLGARGVSSTRVIGDNGLLHADHGERYYWEGKTLVEIDNRVGPIRRVDPELLFPSSSARVTIVTPLALDPSGRTVNTDGDRAAAAIAAACRAPVLTLVTNVSHLLVAGEPVHEISREAAAVLRDNNIASGGMRKKLRAADEALAGGVQRVTLGFGLTSSLRDGHAGTSITSAGDRAQTETAAANG